MKLKKKRSNGANMDVVVGEALGPLMEGPVPEGHIEELYEDTCGVTCWMKGSKRRPPTDPRLLLGVLGCPLAPVPVFCTGPLSNLSITIVPLEASSAQYIVQQYIAATGAMKLQSLMRNCYTSGKVKMMFSQYETATRLFKLPVKSADNGWFTLWHLYPNKWHMELTLEGSMIQSGSDGHLVWRCTPWLGAHALTGPVRPLRRALQGLDPLAAARIFGNAHCVGEKRIGDEDCFVLKLVADPSTLSDRSDGSSQVIRHALFGYFSQRTGWLVYLEDKHLSRVHVSESNENVYWETTIESTLRDYKVVDGITLSHAGHSVVTLLRYGDEATSHTRTRIEETWSIEEVAFNVPGLTPEFFIPPAEVSSPGLTKYLHLHSKPDVALASG
ncbi:hypothetical protein GOP47_0003647 [Adiantum capillus-veneris]|uniref:DUF620 domain-containing protein n=1 Tax=Adiantum capillus-veneris TaxID=13818 RepID=A0A9D4V6I4_ADICA|nr:hypothetical protein GOP47_0003647 [Adiantum capillus-veneris]